MRITRRLHIAVVALTASAVILQGASTAHAADIPADPPSSGRSAPEVMADVNDALRQIDAKPAVEEGTSRGGAGARRTDLPGSAGPATVSDGTGSLTLDVPAEGEDLAPSDDTTSLFKGTGTDTSIAVQATEGGVRSLIHIDSPAAPERFEFPLGGDVASLRLTVDGGVEALGRDGTAIATAPAPWARDANGIPVPTHFEINGTTLVQVVEHRGGYTYGIVADPSVLFWAKCGAALTLFVAQNVTPAKLAKAGTILKSARALVDHLKKFGSAKDAARAFAVFIGSATGVNDLVMRCWPE